MKCKNKVLPYLYILPFVVAFVLFFVAPAGYALVLSFFKFRGYGAMKFVGFDNYKALLHYDAFWQSVKNTIFYFAVHFIPVMVGAFLFAVGLRSKAMGKLQKVFKPILFLPQVVPIMATALIFRIMFSTRSGVINQMLGLNIAWLENRSIMRWVVALMVIWRATGWFMVIFLSGLTTISDDLYEAASLDGATSFQAMTRITVPLMKPFFIFAFIMDAISSFKIFTEPNILISQTSQAPVDVAPMMNMVTNNIRGGNFGMASAAGWLLFIIIMTVSAVGLVITRNKE